MAVDKNKILATEGEVTEICNATINNLSGAVSSVLKNNLSPDEILVSNTNGKISTAGMSFSKLNKMIAANNMALTAGALTWDGTFDNLYRVPIGSEDDMDFGFVRVTEEVPDDFSIMVCLEMGMPTFFGVATALDTPIYQSFEIMPTADSDVEGIYLYGVDLDMGMPFAVIACEGNAEGMPTGVYFLYASIMDKPVMSVASMRFPSYAFNNNSILTDTKVTVSIPNQSVYFWDGNVASAEYKGSLFLGDTEFPLYLKYAGECNLTYEELQTKNIMGFYQDGTNAIMSVKEKTSNNGVKYTELMPMSFFSLTGAVVFYEYTEFLLSDGAQTIDCKIDKPGLYFLYYYYPTMLPMTFIEIENNVHIGELTYSKSIKSSYLPEHLQFGDISYSVQKLESSTVSLGSTLYWTDNNVIVTGDMTKECRVADFKEIPENTVITGVHKNTGEILNLVHIDGKIWGVNDVPTGNETSVVGWYAIIRPSGIYLCNFGGGGYYDSWLSSITFQDMTFTNTTYNVVDDEVQVFKTLDKKYLPDNIVTKEQMDAAIAAMKAEILAQITE